jgi:5-hydroxyisourate hydrolase-like protein (transthyretin family)
VERTSKFFVIPDNLNALQMEFSEIAFILSDINFKICSQDGHFLIPLLVNSLGPEDFH